MQEFSLIMHYPNTIEIQEELSKKVSAVHLRTIIEKLKSLTCPVEQEAALIDAIRHVLKEKMDGNSPPFLYTLLYP